MRVTYWTLVVTAIISTGALMDALGWRSGPAAGITIAVSGAATAAATALAVRIQIVLSRDHGRGPVCDSAPRVNLCSDDGRHGPSQRDAGELPLPHCQTCSMDHRNTAPGD